MRGSASTRRQLRSSGVSDVRIDVEAVRKDFPILAREVHGVPLVYLDSANSAQKPQVVIDAEADLYASHYANVARAVHTLGSRGDRAPTRARATRSPAFLNAPSRDEVIFTKQHHRGAEPARVLVLERDHVPRRRAVPARPGRRDRRHRDGAPQQHRAVAAARAAHRRDVPVDPDRRRGPAGRVGHRRGHQRAHQGRLVRVPVQRARHDQPGRAHRRARPRGRRAVDRRRGAGRAAPAARRAGARRRLRRVHRAQAVRPDRRRRAVGPLRPARRRCRRSSAAAR